MFCIYCIISHYGDEKGTWQVPSAFTDEQHLIVNGHVFTSKSIAPSPFQDNWIFKITGTPEQASGNESLFHKRIRYTKSINGDHSK